METLKIEPTQGTPEITFNSDSGLLRISGRANANNITTFYKNLEVWLDEYLQNPAELTTVELELDYINSVFSKLLFIFLGKCKTVLKKNKKLIVRWYHFDDDEDSIQDSKRYSIIINFPFEVIARK